MVVAAAERRLQISRHAAPEGSWELVRTTPAARLQPYLRSYCGYHEQTPGPSQRRELPGPIAVLILDLGPTLRILDATSGALKHAHAAGFVAGLDDHFTLTETVGEQRGIQVDLDLAGALHIFGVPLSELTRRVVGLDDVFGASVHRLRAQIEEADDWHTRFALLDRFFSARLGDALGDRRGDWVEHAWQRILGSGGLVSIEALAREVGYSRKHLSVSFRERFGMAPKPLARIVRFDRAVQLLRSGQRRSFADVGQECGYFDQAHFIREFRELSGGTPGEYLNPWPAG